MKTLTRKKLYNGNLFEVRSYERDQAIKNGKNVKLIFENEYMILTPTQLKKEGQFINTQYSKINSGQTYGMYGYEWKGKPFREEEVSLNVNPNKLREAMERNGIKL